MICFHLKYPTKYSIISMDEKVIWEIYCFHDVVANHFQAETAAG